MNKTKLIKVFQGDITKMQVDAIVNAANSSLLGGGGVDGAIHKAGGREILEACMQIRAKQGGCSVGDAVITTAGNLQAKFVIHTVGPVWQDGNHQEDILLSNAYYNSLHLAAVNNIQTIAFPNISTGVFRFPKEQAAEIAISTVSDFLNQQTVIQEVVFVCFDKENLDIYVSLINKLQTENALKRFVDAQTHTYKDAYNEISEGKKRSHWMWFIFPQIQGLGSSDRAISYAIQNLKEAELYLSHPILGKRLIDISEALLSINDKSAAEIVSEIDCMKLKSCMTLFCLAKNTNPIFAKVLEKYFHGERCSKTIDILEHN